MRDVRERADRRSWRPALPGSFEHQVARLAVHTSQTAVSTPMLIAWRSLGWISQRVVAEESNRHVPAGLSWALTRSRSARVGILRGRGRSRPRRPSVVAPRPGPTDDRGVPGPARHRPLGAGQVVSSDYAEWTTRLVAERCPDAVICLDLSRTPPTRRTRASGYLACQQQRQIYPCRRRARGTAATPGSNYYLLGMTTFAYVLMTYRNAGQVSRLVARMRELSPDAVLLVRHDARREPLARSSLSASAAELHEYRSVIDWGGWTMVEAQLRELRWLRANTDADYITFLSGQDYPIASLVDWEHRVTETRPDLQGEVRRIEYRPRWFRRGVGDRRARRAMYRYYRVRTRANLDR